MSLNKPDTSNQLVLSGDEIFLTNRDLYIIRTSKVVEEVHRWWNANRERGIASVLFCYALGKAQRVLAELGAFTNEPVYLHGAVDSLTGVYRRFS